jgi:hypothetical protein
MSVTLKESKVSIISFIQEAEKCLENDCGFPAMLTAFSVMLAVSEAVLGKSPKNERYTEGELISSFIDKMHSKNWFKSHQSISTDDEIIKEKLCAIRHGLSHQLSMPDDIFLIQNAQDLENLAVANVAYSISVEDFLQSIKCTIEELANRDECSARIMDPNFGRFRLSSPRELGIQREFLNVSGVGTTYSAAVEVHVCEINPINLNGVDGNFPGQASETTTSDV